MLNPNLTAATDYASRGWLVAPVEIMARPFKGKMKKDPLNRVAWGSNSSTDLAIINDWFSPEANALHPKQGVQIATGSRSGLFVLDADNLAQLDHLSGVHGKLPETYTVVSQSGSMHYYFAWPADRITVSRKNWGTGTLVEREYDEQTGREGGIDIRGEGGVIYAPPTSVYGPGNKILGTYVLHNDVELAEVPQWIIDMYESSLTAKSKAERPRADEDAWLAEHTSWDADFADQTRDNLLAHCREQFQALVEDPMSLWDNGTTTVMGILVRLVNSPWADFDEEDLDAFLSNYAPEDEGFGVREHSRIKNSIFRGADGEVLDLPEGISDAEMQIAHTIWGVKEKAQEKDERTDKSGPLATLPDEFWEARPLFATIRQNAQAATAGPDSTLHAFLAAYMARVPYQYQVDTGMVTPAQPTFFAAICAPSGLGKGASTSMGYKLARNEMRPLPLGTGEGIAEQFLSNEVNTDDPTNYTKEGDLVKNPTMRKVQTNHNILLSESEGSNLAIMLDRASSTLAGIVLKLAVGEELGQTNAYAESSRFVPAASYSAGFVVGLQYGPAGELLSRHGVGLSQRFLWSAVFDPTAPDYIESGPAPVFWEPLPVNGTSKVNVWVDDSIIQPMRHERVLKMRGELVEDEQDSHRIGLLLRISLALRLLDGPNLGQGSAEDGSMTGTGYLITVEDWRLANVLVNTSSKLRQQLVARVAAEEVVATQAAGTKDAVRRTAAQDSEVTIRVQQVIDKIPSLIARSEAKGVAVKMSIIKSLVTKNSRGYVEEALLKMIADGELVISADGNYAVAPKAV